MNKLNVYVEIQGKSKLIGHIDVNNDQGTFSYEEEYLQNPNSSPISISLPLEEKTFNVQRTKTFFDGLLPEGFTRRCVAGWMHKEETDYLSILAGLGRECLGAVKIIAADDNSDIFYYQKMTNEEVKRLAQEGATESAELVTKSHLSLTGASGKVGLYYNEKNKNWYLPVGNAPSTHIVKQSHVRLKNIVANEQLCLLTAKFLGIEVPNSFIIRTEGDNKKDVLFATSRYDRKITASGEKWNDMTIPYRLHQEDFAQALGIPSAEKYEQNNAGYLQKMFAVLRNYSSHPIEDQLKLWNICIFNYLIGNTDNHIKNLSLLYSENLKVLKLAPAYDIVSTIVYEGSTDYMAISIGGNYRLIDITRESFEKEAMKDGLGKNIAMKQFDKMVSGFKDALYAAGNILQKQGFKIDYIQNKILLKGGISKYI